MLSAELNRPMLNILSKMEAWGFEPQTLGLQSRCSSQLSYAPLGHTTESWSLLVVLLWVLSDGIGKGRRKRGESGTALQAICSAGVSRALPERVTSPFAFLNRKEVIQPHLPVRLPCYDFTPLARHTFGAVPLYRLDERLRVPPTRVV